MTITARILAILFVTGEEGVAINDLQATLDIEKEAVINALQTLREDLANDTNTPFKITIVDNKYQLVTKSEYDQDVATFAKKLSEKPLTKAAIETLAIIAYRQPVTRLTVDEIRGVSSQAMIQRLINRQLIKEVGRVETPGRPILYGTSSYFLDYFGLKNLSELPQLEEIPLNITLKSEDFIQDKSIVVNLFDNEPDTIPVEGGE